MGLLGEGFDDPRSAAIMALAGGLLRRDFGGGLLGANQAFMQARGAQEEREFNKLRMQEAQENLALRRQKAAQEVEALRRAEELRREIPTLFRQPGVAGGQPMPQEMGGIPMFSKPMGAAPMQATPGGFDVQRALALGMSPEQISSYAGLQNIGRQEVARTIETTDPQGRPVTIQLDKFGQPIGQGLGKFTAPTFQNLGNRTVAIDPVTLQPRGEFAIGMSPSERDASARGWATVRQGDERLKMDKNQYTFNAELGGYVPKTPGGQFIPLAANKDATPKLTESQAKSGLYLGQMRSASDMLSQLERQGISARPEAVAMTGNAITNYLAPKAAQQVAQIQNQWSEAYLRAKTGAAATQGEVDLNNRTFFPQPGDSPEVIAQKAQARAQAEMDMQLPAGPAAVRTKIAPPVNTGGSTGGWGIQKVQ